MSQGCSFPKKGDIGEASNYRGITLTSIAAKFTTQCYFIDYDLTVITYYRETQMDSTKIYPHLDTLSDASVTV